MATISNHKELFMSIRQAGRRVAISIAAAAAVGAFPVIAFAGTASATTPVPQSAVIDPTNAGNQTINPGTPFSSGQDVTVTVPANTSNGGDGPLESDVNFTIYECSDPGGTAANLPQSVSSCDSNTALGTSSTTGDDGSVDYNNYEIYSLPNTIPASSGGLGEGSTHTPVCNLANPCVLAVITDPNNFTDPTGIAFSQPFVVSPNSKNSGANPGDGTPEAPLAIGLPLLGLAAVGGTLFFRRRKALALAGTDASSDA